MAQSTKHQSILVSEVINALQPKPTGIYLDATFGGGGHSRAILEASAPNGRIISLDRDENAGQFAQDIQLEYKERFRFEPISYTEVGTLGQEFDGALMDLGLSSDQLETDGRGFSFKNPNDPLDLRFDLNSNQTAAQFLNQANLKDLEHVFREFAEDRYWRGLAQRIVENRKNKRIETVGDFISVVGNGNPKVLAPLFQGLRIQVNDELATLESGLYEIANTLKVDGTLTVISFHSLEDRIVKNFFRTDMWQIVTKKPIVPSVDEIANNPRSRSAKLRVAKKMLTSQEVV